MKLSAFLLARCAEPAAASDGRFHARPGTPSGGRRGAGTTRLGLAKGRDGVYYAPRRNDDKPAPLILYLHGATGSGAYAIQRLTEHADRTGTIIVAPDSRSRTWGMIDGNESADVAFIDSALRKIFDTHAIDAKRIGIAGFSDGASAALSWGLINGDLFSGIAAFSPGFLQLSSRPNGEPRIFISHGTDDEILPVDRCGRRIARGLREAGYTVEYREFEGNHTVPAEIREAGLRWMFTTPSEMH